MAPKSLRRSTVAFDRRVRKANGEDASLLRQVLDGQSSAHGLHVLSRNGQAQTEPGSVNVHLGERHEHRLRKLRRKTAAPVFNVNEYAVINFIRD